MNKIQVVRWEQVKEILRLIKERDSYHEHTHTHAMYDVKLDESIKNINNSIFEIEIQ